MTCKRKGRVSRYVCTILCSTVTSIYCKVSGSEPKCHDNINVLIVNLRELSPSQFDSLRFSSVLLALLVSDEKEIFITCTSRIKLKINVRTLDIAPRRSESSPQKRTGMALVLKGFHSFTCTPTCSPAIGMSHTCLCLLSS